MTLSGDQHIHFTGIGGVGMAGLALICRDFGIQVSGTDMVMSKNIGLLEAVGATVHVGHNGDHLESPDVLVYSSAIPPDNPERTKAQSLGIPQYRRGEFLAELAMSFPVRVSCAGSHGKTSISAMLTHILQTCGKAPGYLIGGQPVNLDLPASAGSGQLLVTEVDESDGTQALMQSTHAIISNIEDDHCWSLGGPEKLFECFSTFAQRSDVVVAWDTPKTREILRDHPDCHFICDDDIPDNLHVQVPGHHNRVNATLAITLAEMLDVSSDDAIKAMASFQGVDRRMSVRFTSEHAIVIEDYAHHPTEVDAAIHALRESYPNRRLHVIFQPHRFERIARYSEEFSHTLSQADEVTVTAPFAAWTDDNDRADPKQISTGIADVPSHYFDGPFDQLAEILTAEPPKNSVFAVLGAGSITQLIPFLTQRLRGEL